MGGDFLKWSGVQTLKYWGIQFLAISAHVADLRCFEMFGFRTSRPKNFPPPPFPLRFLQQSVRRATAAAYTTGTNLSTTTPNPEPGSLDNCCREWGRTWSPAGCGGRRRRPVGHRMGPVPTGVRAGRTSTGKKKKPFSNPENPMILELPKGGRRAYKPKFARFGVRKVLKIWNFGLPLVN